MLDCVHEAREHTLGALTALVARDMLTVKADIFSGIGCVKEAYRKVA